MNLVTPTAGAKREVLLHKLASDKISFVHFFFNEADTLESSSILIYSELHAGSYRHRIG